MSNDIIFDLISSEKQRQNSVLNMIPSENFVSKNVLQAVGSVLINKYSEGYPGKRYYQGNKYIDKIEQIAIDRAKELFGAEHANVQSHSGAPANLAVFFAFLNQGDTYMGLDLSCGGHLSHGSPVNISGRYFNPISYGVDKETGKINMDNVRQLALKHKPKLIISGHSAYTRQIDFKAFQDIADEVGAIHLADISHIAGLVASKLHPSPFPFTDIVTTTTHKTLRGPRGALIMCKKKFAKKIDKAIFPGTQGGPHNHSIAAKAVAFKEAMSEDFKKYSKQIILNSKVLAKTLISNGIKLVSNGTDNHIVLVDLTPFGIGLGKQIAESLEQAGIVCNANTIPYDPSTPFKPSGIRLGTPTLTTQGMVESDMENIGLWISQIIKEPENKVLLSNIKNKVELLCKQYKFYI